MESTRLQAIVYEAVDTFERLSPGGYWAKVKAQNKCKEEYHPKWPAANIFKLPNGDYAALYPKLYDMGAVLFLGRVENFESLGEAFLAGYLMGMDEALHSDDVLRTLRRSDPSVREAVHKLLGLPARSENVPV